MIMFYAGIWWVWNYKLGVFQRWYWTSTASATYVAVSPRQTSVAL